MPSLASVGTQQVKPYWQSDCGAYTVYMADCRRVIPMLGVGTFDAVVTDAPYGVSYQSNRRTKSAQFDVLLNDDTDMRLGVYVALHPLLKDDSVLVAFASFSSYPQDYLTLQGVYDVKNVIVWDKGGGGIGDLVNSLFTDYELATVAHKGRCPIIGKRIGSVWQVGKVNPSDMVHATEKPVDLLVQLVGKWVHSGGRVLDPFMGSGTTGVACVQLGVDFVGVEQDEAYCRVAVGRIQRAMMERGLMVRPGASEMCEAGPVR